MLEFKKIALKSAGLNEQNNLPDITAPENSLWFECDKTISEKEKELIGKGMVVSVLPYKIQDMYDANLQQREYTSAVLENEYLRAEFLPEFGGRLWSLYDKKLKKDIIYKNDALIFRNLALRNAWFAGGVEWNVGVRGHSYFTCSPLFTKKVKGKLGHDILRMYEYEEIRGLVYCIEATLEKDNLVVNITVKNVNNKHTYMYWWSNIAIEQKEGTRFFVPCKKSFVTSYRNGGFCISKVDIPYVDSKDISNPYHPYDAIDYFFDIPDKNKKWISSIESDGKGLLQYSDNTLFGRKAFLWGNLPGGKHWNSWLTYGRDYYEIQAGLLKTQFEHFIAEPNEEFNWCEVYRGIDIDSNSGEYAEICEKIDAIVPNKLDFSEIFTATEEEKCVVYGRGKGYLFERIEKRKFHEKCEFPLESVGENEQYYLDILDKKETIGNENTEFISGEKWKEVIETKENLTAFDKYILALIYYRKQDFEQSLDLLTQSVKESERYYSLMALALLSSNVFKDHKKALKFSQRAVEIVPEDVQVAIKYSEIAIRAQEYKMFAKYYDNAAQNIKNNGRIRMYMGQCLVKEGELERAKEFINKDLVVEDFKEGEYSVSSIWVELYRAQMSSESGIDADKITDKEVLERYPLPYEIDFRMH